jgi:hypothetical protein
MGGWTLHWEQRTPVPPAKARAWWFDLQPDDHNVQEYQGKGGGKSATRKIVSRSDKEVRTEDTWGRFAFPSHVWLEGMETLKWRIGKGSFVNDGTLRFLPDGSGTRVVYDSVVTAKGLAGLFVSLGKANAIEQSKEDMGLHMKHMEREWREKPW